MKKILSLVVLTLVSSLAMADQLRVAAMGRNETGLGSFRMHAGRNGDQIRGMLTLMVRTPMGMLGLHGVIDRLDYNPDTHVVSFAGRARSMNGNEFVVSGHMLDGGEPAQDNIRVAVRRDGEVVFEAATSRQSVQVRFDQGG